MSLPIDSSPGLLRVLPSEFPLVGREEEIRLIRRFLEVERAEGGRALLVRGDAGVGKTRLVRTVIEDARAKEMQVFDGRAFALDQGLSYAVLADAFVPFLREAESHTLQTLTRGRLAELHSLFPSAADGGAVADMAGAGSPEEMRIALFSGFSELLRGLSGRAPVLVVAEDLQWADPSAIQLLHFAIRQLADQPVSFVCTSLEGLRERNPALLEFESSLTGAGLAEPLGLRPLVESEIRELVSRTFSLAGDVVAAFSAQLFEWSQGNPLFATEALKAMVESGQLSESDGVWSGWDIRPAELPRGVLDLVASRFARVSEAAQRLGQVAAAMGDRIRFDVMRSVAELSAEEALEAVDELRMRGILREGGEGGVRSSLTFTHPLIRECVYTRMSGPKVRNLHRAIGDALEAADFGGLGERAEELAHHFHRSGDRAPRGKALQYLGEAGRRALERRADEEAARHLSAALAIILDGSSEAELDESDEIRVAADLARALNRLGRYEEAIALYKQALRSGVAEADPTLVAEIRRRLGLACFWSGRYTEALAHFEAGLASARNDSPERGRLLLVRGLCHQELARWEEAGRDVNEALTLAEKHDDARTRIVASQLLTLHHTWTGSPTKAREHGWEAIRQAEVAADLGGAFESHLALAMMEGLTGNLTEMTDRLREARRLAEELRSPILELRTDELSLQEAHATGAWDSAVALGLDAVQRARALGQHALLARFLVWTALPILGRGDIERGRALVDEAWNLSGLGPDGEPGSALDVHAAVPAVIGRTTLLLAEGDVGAATAVAERGLEMADRSGAAIWSIHHLIPLLAESYLLARDLEGAQRIGQRLRRDATRMDHMLGLAWADACDALVTWLSGDIEGGSTRLRAAADRLEGIPMTYDAARVRRQLAGRLAELGRTEEALGELRRAHAIFRDLGAEPELEKSRGMFKEMETRPPPRSLTRGLGGLTGRELEVARLVASRRSNKAIAKELSVSPRTVTTHLTNIYRKLEVGSRGELVDLVRDRGWAGPA